MPSNNPKPTFNIFGHATRCDIRVGYISTTRGYVDNVGVYEANKYAKLDPGTTFIFKTRDVIRYLSINEVNKLNTNDLLPEKWGETCKGPQLNIEPQTPQISFNGGGGVGATANPIIGSDGSLMAVDMVEKGYGYHYAPQVNIHDDLNIGAGTLLKSKLCEDDKTYIVYDKEEDYEEYDLTSCRGVDLNDYGPRYNIYGKPVGLWDPTVYANLSKDPIRAEIYEYQRYLARGLNPWWTTRKQPPLSITSDSGTNRTKHDVTHKGWSPWLNTYAISPVSPSNVPGSDNAGILFTFVWEEDFPYDGQYVFKALRDNTARVYLDNVLIWDLQTSGFNHKVQSEYVEWSTHKSWGSSPFTKKETITAGVHQIRVELLNLPIKEKVLVQPSRESNDTEIKITTNAQYGNGVKIPELGIDVKKEYKGAQINETFIRSLDPGHEYPVILTSPETNSEDGGIRIRTQGDNVLQAEESTDNDWTDIEIVTSQGRFIEVPSAGGNGEVRCKFVVGQKGNKVVVDTKLVEGGIISYGKSSKQVVDPSLQVTGGILVKDVFNTVDWMGRANRQLWRTNVYGRGGFLNVYGVCPFNTMNSLGDNPYAGTHRIVWNNVKFPFAGNFAIEVAVDDNVNLQFKREGKDAVSIRKEGFVDNDSTRPTGKSTYVRYFEKGTYQLIADLEQIPGGAFGFGGQGGGGSTANVQAKFIKRGNEFYLDVRGNGSATISFTMKSNDGWGTAGVAAKEIRINSDRDIIKLRRTPNRGTETKRGSGFFTAGKQYRVNVIGSVSGAGQPRVFDGSIQLLDAHGNDTNVELKLTKISNQVVNSIKGLNPMALAVVVKTAYSIEEVISPKSWQENPMGLALTIDAPMPPVPQEPIINQDGRCPRNPTWTTRFPGAKQQWWPVNWPSRGDLQWSRFQNRYALSPVPPLSTVDSDGGGVTYTNSWPLVIDHSGYYGVRGTRDNYGAVLINGQVISKLDSFGTEDPKTTKVYLEKGKHTIGVQIGSHKTDTYKLIDRKVFSTADWAVKQSVTKESGIVDVIFNVSSDAKYSNSIEIVGLFKESKSYDGPQINRSHTIPVEYGKVYDVIFGSVQTKAGVRLRTKGENVIEMEDASDMDWTDIICSASRGKFFDLGSTKIAGGSSSDNIGIVYSGLNSTNNPIRVTNDATRIALKDSSGSDANASFVIESGKARFSPDGKSIKGVEKVKINLSWNDNPKTHSVAVGSISILGVTWTQAGGSGSVTKTVDLGKGGSGGSTNRAKFMIEPKTKVIGGSLLSGTSKDGIRYEGPELASYRGGALGPLLSPAWDTDYEYRHEFMHRAWTSVWSGVNFPSSGRYTLKCTADDWLRVYIDDVEIGDPPDFAAEVFEGVREYSFNVGEGIHNIKLDYYNIPGNNTSTFWTNPVVFSAVITDKVSVTTGHSKSWVDNPTGISAVLLPPPCPRTVEGRGRVCEVEVIEPGNGWPIDITPLDTPSYAVSLDLVDIIPVTPGINYDCAKDKIVIEPSNGAEATPICGSFGQITGVTMVSPGIGFTKWPNISIVTDEPTGVNATFRPVFEVRRDPLDGDIDPDKLIQVTDLAGLKQTGYYNGRPYYGAVFYKEGIRYAGYYETAGQLIQIYDTMQESIDAEVTTPPSAIQRSGTDITSNDPRLNIPGTPDNLT